MVARERFFSDPSASQASGSQFQQAVEKFNNSSPKQSPQLSIASDTSSGASSQASASPKKRVVSPTRLKTLSRGLESIFRPQSCTVHVEDPWIKRQDSAPGALVYSVHNSDTNPVGRGLYRSNSTSSINESRERIACVKQKGHRRMPSDTLIFTNRNALFQSPRFNKKVMCSRYATPPRDCEPDEEELLQRDIMRTVSRYATPPRSLMDPANLESSQTADYDWMSTPEHKSPGGINCDFLERKVKAAHLGHGRLSQSAHTSPNRRPHFGVAASDSTQLSPVSLNDLDRYLISDSVSPRASMLSASVAGRSPSCHVSMTAVSSPTSPSGDSIVDSLKHAVISITSKLTGRHNNSRTQSDSSSPARFQKQHSLDSNDEVFDAENDSRQRGKERSAKHKFVYSLARAYSDRIKKRTRPFERSTPSPKEKETIAKQLTSLLKDNKPGSVSLGARISSTVKPIELGTYTLPRQRPPRPQRDQKVKSQDVDSLSSSEHSSRETTPETHTLNAPFKLPFTDLIEESDTGSSAHDSGCIETVSKDSKPPDQNGKCCEDHEEDSDSFYERRFVEDLEFNIEDELFRDSAVYSDDGLATEAESTLQKLSIRETIRRLEHKQRLNQCQKSVSIQPREKSHGIKDIVKTLESKGSFVKDKDSIDVEQIQLKTVKDRTRELVECARSTRIRSESLSLVHEDSASEDEENVPSSPDREVLASRKGRRRYPQPYRH